MKHKLPKRNPITDLKFAPFEDFLGIGHVKGIQSVVIPGAGEANFDAYEANPFETKTQRREGEIHKILEKLQPSSITLDPKEIGTVDKASKEVKELEAKEAYDDWLSKHSKKDKRRKRKARGKNKIGNEKRSSQRQ